METNELEKKLTSFIGVKEDDNNIKEELLSHNQDGLLERVEYINKKYVTNDGRQLLKEINFEL